MVTTACPSTIVPLLSFVRFRKNVSSGSVRLIRVDDDVDRE